MRRTNEDLARFVVKSFTDMGFNVNPSSRVMRQHNVLLAGADVISFGTPEFFIAVEALRDLQMLSFIFERANDDAGQVFRDLVKKCLSDSTLSEDDKEKTPGRDAQFELFVAAVCKHAGLLPVEHREPDVVFTVGNLNYCIAAKRPKSIKAVDNCLRDACDQISREKLPGFIAIDTSVAFALERDVPPLPELDDIWELIRQWRIRLSPIDDASFADFHKSAMNFVIGKFKDAIDRRMAGRRVLGIVFNDQMLRVFHDGSWGLTGSTIIYPTSTGAEFDLVAKQFLKGLPALNGDVQN
jgi:hypothetical protein